MTPFDLPAAQNPLRTRDQVRLLLEQLLAPLGRRAILGGAGFHLGHSAADYSSRTAAFEGWARMLWGLAPLLAGGGTYANLELHLSGLRAGTDPASRWFWGEPGDADQRFVEMTALAVGLLMAPEHFWHPLSDSEKDRLCSWLDLINHRTLPMNNWQFFRVLVNVALMALARPHNQGAMDESLAHIDRFSRDDGWYADRTNFDYYNPFAFHYYGLIYARYMGDRDQVRCMNYLEKSRCFAAQIVPWFHVDGSAVPYGRSLTYRFAMASFFSACAFVKAEVVPWGVMKGLVLRHLRWWLQRPILDHDGILTIGYAYPNLLMAEQYNSPSSPYWALKTFLVLAMGEDHPFWSAPEEPLPGGPATIHESVPHYVVQKTEQDTILLCSGSYPNYEVLNAAAKYSKFAYSARFGFCVAHPGSGLEKMGGDSMLLLSEGDGFWRERRHTEDRKSGPFWVSSLWRPWKGTMVRTWILALEAWHIRVHRLETDRPLDTAEGGFSAPYPTHFGLEPPRELDAARRARLDDSGHQLGSAWFMGHEASSLIVSLKGRRKGEIVSASPNLNLAFPRVGIPTLTCHLEPGVHWLACAVLAGDPHAVSCLAANAPVLHLQPDQIKVVCGLLEIALQTTP